MLEGTLVFKGNHNGIDIVIRHVRRDDVERLLTFINVISKEQTYILFQGEQMSLEEESRYVEDFIKKAENNKAVKLLIFHNDEFIGLADVTMKERAESHMVYLESLLPKSGEIKEWENSLCKKQ